MYESPITQMIDDITTEMIHQQEDAIMVQIKQSVGYAIDKDELVKALQNDRNQYKKGFNDCMKLLEEIKAEIRYFMFEVNPSSSESDYACNYILDLIDKKMGKESEC